MNTILEVLQKYKNSRNNPVIYLNRRTNEIWVSSSDQVYDDDAIMCLCSYLDPVDLRSEYISETVASINKHMKIEIEKYKTKIKETT